MTWLFKKFGFKLINMIVLIFGTCDWHVWAWCRELHVKRGCHEILKKARVEISMGTMGIDSWCLLLSCGFGLLWIVELDLRLFLCLFYGHTTLFVVSCCYWFLWSSSCLFLVFPFTFWVLGIGWERGNLMEIRRDVWYPTDDIRPRWSYVHE